MGRIRYSTCENSSYVLLPSHPSSDCKNLRRVGIKIQSGTVPHPDGRLPVTVDVTERLSERILELEREIEEREARQRELEVTVAVLGEISV